MSTLETTQATFTRDDDDLSLTIVTVGGTDPALTPEEVKSLRSFLAAPKAKSKDAKDDE